MAHLRILLTGILGLFGMVALAPEALAGSPLRFVPPEADVLIEVPHLRGAADALLTLDAVQRVKATPQVKELLASTSYRRFYQLVAHFEKELGANWPELLDRVGGKGAVLAVTYGPNPAVLAVLEGSDEKSSARAFDTVLAVVEAELTRQESKAPITRVALPGRHVTVTVGDGLFLARCGAVVLVSNNRPILDKALELVEKGGKSMADQPGVVEGRGLLPEDSLVRLWLNMESARKLPGAADFYKTPRDPPLTVLFGSYVDILGRTPFVAAALVRDGDGLALRIRLPRGREGMGPDAGLHLPPAADQPGSRPLLEPPGVLYSYSFYLDVSHIWTDREVLFGPQAAKAMEEADRNTGKIPLNGVRLSKMLTEAGSYHRIVVANQARLGYDKKPQQVLPAFGVVTEMRNPDGFYRSAGIALRGLALAQTGTYKIKLVDETYKDVPIVCYRFAEDKAVPEDVTDVRFNFSPCFCRVGKQLVVCSTLDLCRDLIDLLQAEAKHPDAGSPAIARQRLHADGVATALAQFEDQIMTQAILDQAVPAEEARAQAKAFIELVRGLGHLSISARIDSRVLSYDISLVKVRTLSNDGK